MTTPQGAEMPLLPGAGEDYVRETKSLLLRASLLQHDLVQRSTSTVPHLARGPGRPALPERF